MLVHVLGDWMSKQCDLSPSGSPLAQLHHSMDTYISLSGLSPCKANVISHGSSTLMTSKVISVQSSTSIIIRLCFNNTLLTYDPLGVEIEG